MGGVTYSDEPTEKDHLNLQIGRAVSILRLQQLGGALTLLFCLPVHTGSRDVFRCGDSHLLLVMLMIIF